MPWTQGESGNPQGREPGTGKVQRLYAHVAADDLAAIVAAIVAAAKNGGSGTRHGGGFPGDISGRLYAGLG